MKEKHFSPNKEEDGVRYKDGEGLHLDFLRKEEEEEKPADVMVDEDLPNPEIQELREQINPLFAVVHSFIGAGRDQYYANLEKDTDKASAAKKVAIANLEILQNARDVLLRAMKIDELHSQALHIALLLTDIGFAPGASYEKSAHELSRDLLASSLEAFNARLNQSVLSDASYPLSQLAKICYEYPDDPAFSYVGTRTKEILERHFDLFKEQTEGGANTNAGNFGDALHGLEGILASGGVSAGSSARILAQLFHDNPNKDEFGYHGLQETKIEEIVKSYTGFRVAENQDGESMELTGPGKILMEAILKRYGLHAEDYMQDWANAAFSLDPGRGIWEMRAPLLLKNLKAIRSLESKQVGIVRTLREEFQLTCLGRYSEKSLMRQYEERDTQGDYYPVFVVIADHNGGIDSEVIYDRMQQEVAEQGRNLMVRYVEFNNNLSSRDIAEQLIKKYGATPFGSVKAHGEGDKLLTAGMAMKNVHGAAFGVEDLEKGDLGLFKIFSPGSDIVLAACSTGVKGGFAQKLSGVGSFKVKAPEKEASCTDLAVTILPSGGIEVDPKYQGDLFKSVACKMYVNGALIESSL